MTRVVQRRITGHQTSSPNDDRLDAAELSLRYDDAHPFEVRITVTDHEGVRSPVWRFDRGLLKAACMVVGAGTFGKGDVAVGAVTSGRLCFRLVVAGCETYVIVPTAPVRGLVVESERLVPPGTETHDVDAWIEALLKGSPS